MKRRFIAISVAIMAFLVMPLRANAAYNSTSGNMGGYDVSAYVSIDATSASAGANTQCSVAYCSVSLTYVYIDETTQEYKTVPASSAGPLSAVNAYASRVGVDQGHVCRSYSATSTPSVSFGIYDWKPGSLSVYY